MNHKQKIVIVSECPYSGILSSMLQFAEELSEYFEILFLLPSNERNRYGEVQKASEYKLAQFGTINRMEMKKGIYGTIQGAAGLQSFLRDNEARAVISFTNYAGKINRLLFAYNRLLRRKQPLSLHSPNSLDFSRKPNLEKHAGIIFEYLFSRSTNLTLACSIREKKQLIEEYHHKDTNVLLIPNVSTMPVNSKVHYNGTFIIVGRVSHDKGVLQSLQALTQVVDSEKITVIGDGPDKEKLQKQYPEVEFTGNIIKSELEKRMSRANFVVSSSMIEGLPFSILESMSYGVVPILSDVPGHTELVDSNLSGYLFNDEKELTAILGQVLKLTSDDYKSMAAYNKLIIRNIHAHRVQALASLVNYIQTFGATNAKIYNSKNISKWHEKSGASMEL